MTDSIQLKRHAKGDRPYFFDDPAVDKLLAMVMALAGEVSVLRDRLDTVERLAEASGAFTREEVESYRPDQTVAAEREEVRGKFLEQVLRIVELDVSGMGRNDISSAYGKVVKDVRE